jgi:CO/xanthine dehydrogenase Mo-binding subunit
MCYARVVRPPHAQARLRAVDQTPVEQMPGVVAVVRDGSFLAVVARREEQAIAAADQLRATTTWTGTSELPPQSDLNAYLQEQEGQSFLIVDGAAVDDPLPPLATPPGAARTISATYSRPYQMHASLGPSAAVAWWRGEELTLWVHSQGVFPQRAAIAEVLGMAPEAIRVIYRDGPGCYGHNGADDAALDAALLARALPGHPIALQWSRADEHRWEPYAPPMIVQMQGSLDAAGRVIAWNHDVWSPSHFGRPRAGGKTSGLLAAWHLQDPFPPPPSWPSPWRHSSAQRNADPLYALPHRRVVKHFVPHSPLRVSSLRSLGAFANVFAIESFMDELAHAAGVDPVTFRHNHLDDPRARAVIDAAVARAGAPPAGPNRGRGLAFARYKNQQTYAAVLVDVAVDREAGIVHLERAIIAADAGQIINPDGLSNQLEGGFVQAASMTLKEEVTFDAGGVTSADWESYPILRFPEAPVVEVVLLDRPAFPHMGAGEAATGPTPAAIANAICNASGLRLRHIPFTPDRVRAGAAR